MDNKKRRCIQIKKEYYEDPLMRLELLHSRRVCIAALVMAAVSIVLSIAVGILCAHILIQ